MQGTLEKKITELKDIQVGQKIWANMRIDDNALFNTGEYKSSTLKK